MMLGDVLAAAHRAAALLAPALLAEIEAAQRAPGEFARAAVAEFERGASEEDWATLMSTIRNAELPGAACLEAMVRWKLRRPDPHPATADHENEEP